MEGTSQRKKLLILFITSFLMRVAFVITLKNEFYFDDEFEYYRIVQNFLTGRGFFVSEGLKGFRPPLYPFVLSVLFFLRFNLTGIRIFQCFISSITVCFTYLTAKKLFSERIAIWSGIVASIYPFFVFYNGFLLTETFFIFLVVLSIYPLINFSDRPSSSVKSGISLGLAGLCRPTMQLYLPVSLLHIACEREKWRIKIKKMFFISLFFALTLTPWIIRNYIVFSKFIPGTTMGGRVFWEGNNPYSDGGPCRYFPEEIEKLPETERDKAYYKKTLDVIKENPSRFLWLLQNKFKRFWNVVPNASEFTKPLYRVVSVISFGVMMPFFVLGFFITIKDRKIQFIHSLIILFTIFHIIFLASIRYRVPLEPFYIIFAVYGFFWLVNKVLSII
ncbi:MAG: glycosyltransferase family 39 protein [Candidatus Omnitrophica bacterium]|nr:glycosyltransferase family 39 protein [Candidatus Omnitrophota bacterium]